MSLELGKMEGFFVVACGKSGGFRERVEWAMDRSYIVGSWETRYTYRLEGGGEEAVFGAFGDRRFKSLGEGVLGVVLL